MFFLYDKGFEHRRTLDVPFAAPRMLVFLLQILEDGVSSLQIVESHG